MTSRRFALLLGVSLISLTPTVALAEGHDPASMSATEKTTANGPAERFGRQGQIALSSDAALTIQSSSTSGVPGSTMTVSLHPAADYFVMQSVSVGGFIGFDYAKTGDNHSNRIGIGPRIGYDLALSDLVSLWPKVGFAYSSTSTTISAPGGAVTTTGSASTLNLFVPVMFHPAPHFFAGFGPFLDTDLSGDFKTTVYGVKLTVGGYLLGGGEPGKKRTGDRRPATGDGQWHPSGGCGRPSGGCGRPSGGCHGPPSRPGSATSRAPGDRRRRRSSCLARRPMSLDRKTFRLTAPNGNAVRLVNLGSGSASWASVRVRGAGHWAPGRIGPGTRCHVYLFRLIPTALRLTVLPVSLVFLVPFLAFLPLLLLALVFLFAPLPLLSLLLALLSLFAFLFVLLPRLALFFLRLTRLLALLALLPFPLVLLARFSLPLTLLAFFTLLLPRFALELALLARFSLLALSFSLFLLFVLLVPALSRIAFLAVLFGAARGGRVPLLPGFALQPLLLSSLSRLGLPLLARVVRGGALLLPRTLVERRATLLGRPLRAPIRGCRVGPDRGGLGLVGGIVLHARVLRRAG